MQVQQISNFGTTNPIVARITFQTQELLQYFDVTQEQKDQIIRMTLIDIQPTLLACWQTAQEIDQQVKARQKEVAEKGILLVGAGAYQVPAIPDLRPRAEMFLYQAKSVLRDLTQIFQILFDKRFSSARFDLIVKWVRQQFGPHDNLTEMLETDIDWTGRVVRMRNAVEHPGGYSGRLHIENFTADKKNSVIEVCEPRWYLNDEPKCPIAQEMMVTVDNLLTICEQTLLLCLQKFKKDLPILIGEVPESQRDPNCPVRYKMMVDLSKVKLPPEKPVETTQG
jgi:hypothetical protein